MEGLPILSSFVPRRPSRTTSSLLHMRAHRREATIPADPTAALMWVRPGLSRHAGRCVLQILSYPAIHGIVYRIVCPIPQLIVYRIMCCFVSRTDWERVAAENADRLLQASRFAPLDLPVDGRCNTSEWSAFHRAHALVQRSYLCSAKIRFLYPLS